MARLSPDNSALDPAQERGTFILMMLKRVTVLCVLALCCVSRGISAGPGNATLTNAAAPLPGRGTNAMQAAALKGVQWLVAKKDEMSLSFALKTFEKIHRATADENLRKQLAGLIHEESRELPSEAPSVNLGDPELRNWHALRPLVMDLIYLKSLGKPWKAEADKIVQMYAEHGDALLPGRATLSERLVAAYKLQLLGVPTGPVYSNTLAEIRSSQVTALQSGGGIEMMHLYARAHVIFTASAYYTRYLNPVEFAPEVDCFSIATRKIAAIPQLNDSWGDLASEILIAQKLLRQPSDEYAEVVRQKLLAMQNKDGSWGAGPVSNGKVHFTALATLALMEFAPEFRICVDYL